MCRPVGATQRSSMARHSRLTTASFLIISRSARARSSSAPPLSSVAGIVVTSIDCLTLVGPPMPQYTSFPPPHHLRGLPCQPYPTYSQPFTNPPLLAFG